MNKNIKEDIESLESIVKALETGEIPLDEARDMMKKAKFTF